MWSVKVVDHHTMTPEQLNSLLLTARREKEGENKIEKMKENEEERERGREQDKQQQQLQRSTDRTTKRTVGNGIATLTTNLKIAGKLYSIIY